MRDAGWVPVCRLDDLAVEHGVAVLVHGRAVAVFRTPEDRVHAVADRDPFSHAGHLARGLVGVRDGATVVSSPQHLRAFDLESGICLDDPGVKIATYEVRVRDGVVEVGRRRDRPARSRPA